MHKDDPNIAHFRLASQHLLASSCKTATELVTHFAAVQGQEYGPTKWGLGLRLPHLQDPDIEQELQTGKILRTHLLRPTWHFVAANDIRWLLKLTAPRVHAANAFMYRKLELDAPFFHHCNTIITKTLTGNKHCTRNALNDAFKAQNIIADGLRLSYIMMNAELEGLICNGPRQGNQFTYMLLEENVPPANPLTHEEALAELTQRYFTSRGPATLKDFSTWSGLTLADCKKGIAMHKSQFPETTIDGKPHYFSATHIPDATPTISAAAQSQRLYLLPIYDEYIMGYQDRNAIFTFFHSLQLPTKPSFDNMIVYQGQVIGTWKRTIGKKRIDLECNFFQPLNAAQEKALQAEIQRYSEFMGMEVQCPSLP